MKTEKKGDLRTIMAFILFGAVAFFIIFFIMKGKLFADVFTKRDIPVDETLDPNKYLFMDAIKPKQVDISPYSDENWFGVANGLGKKQYHTIEIWFDKEIHPDKENSIDAVKVYMDDTFGSRTPSAKTDWITYDKFLKKQNNKYRELNIYIDNNDKKKLVIENIVGQPAWHSIGGWFVMIRIDPDKFQSKGGAKLNPNTAVLKFET